jgi:hypothetical protein
VSNIERIHPSSEIPPIARRPEYSDQLNNFREAISQLPIGTHGGDVIPMFSKVILEDLDNKEGNSPELKKFIEVYLEDRPDSDTEPSSYRAKLFFNEFQYMFLDRARDTYPRTFEKEDVMRNAIRDLLNDPETYYQMSADLMWFNVQTNEPRRYAGLQLAINSHLQHTRLLPADPTHVDIGTSVGLGIVQIVEGIPFKNIRIHHESSDLRRQLRETFAAKTILNHVVGFDRLPANIPWVEANSYYVEEFGDSEKSELRKRLYYGLDKISVLQADLLDPQQLEVVHRASEAKDGKFDASSALTVIHQMPDTLKAQKSQESLTRTLAVIQDYAEIDPDDPTQLLFSKAIAKSSYNLFVKYASDPRNQAWHMLGSWGKSGRCYQFTPTQELERLYLDGAIPGAH